MQSIEPYRPDPLYKAFFSLEALLAYVCMFAFWLTVRQYSESIPINYTSQEESGDIVAQANLLPAASLVKAGQLERAADEANRLLKENKLSVVNMVCAGNVLIATGSPGDGLKLLQRAVMLKKSDRRIRLNYADKLRDLLKVDEAIAQYGILSKDYPSWDVPHERMALMFMSLDRPLEAATELSAILELNQGNADARKLRGLALARGHQSQEGLNEYVEGIARESNRLSVPKDLKMLLSDWSQLERVKYELTQQVAQRPEDYLPRLRLAQVHMYTGQNVAAKELLYEARKYASHNPEVHRTLAVVLKKLGDNNQAVSEFVLALNLEHPPAKGSAPAPRPSR